MQSHAIVLSEKEGYALSSVFEEELQLQRDEENRLKSAIFIRVLKILCCPSPQATT